jgi:hypothetical protein
MKLKLEAVSVGHNNATSTLTLHKTDINILSSCIKTARQNQILRKSTYIYITIQSPSPFKQLELVK